MTIFTPDNEPYQGRELVYHFDQTIISAMETNAKIGPWTHGQVLSPLQRAATEIIPHGFSIALSVRELIRQGYLISAEILLRPLVERSAVISYLSETPSELSQWEKGWPYESRPPLFKMLAAMRGNGSPDENESMAREITGRYNKLIHADPFGARRQAADLGDGRIGYSASKSLKDVEKCDGICSRAMCYLIVLMARAAQIFPEALSGDELSSNS